MIDTNDGERHRKLNSFGVLLLTMSCLSPLFLIGIAVAVVWAVVYAELGSAFEHRGAREDRRAVWASA